MPRIATFDLIRSPPRPAATAATLARVPTDRRALSRADGMVLGRLLGTGAGASTSAGADLGRWAAFAVWEDAGARDAFDETHPLARRWRDHAVEHWSARLEPRASRGRWGGLEPFRPVDLHAGDGPPAVLTRASVRTTRLVAFQRGRRAVDTGLDGASGLVARLGMGEWPIARQATFSLWRDADAVAAFAGGGAHGQAVRRSRDEGWYSEELFTTFAVTAHHGDWDGSDPLGMHVRLARAGDVGGLGELERESARRFDGLGLGNLDGILPAELLAAGASEGRLWVAERSGAVVGFALAMVVDGYAHLRELDVSSAHGRHGAGTALVDAVITWARAGGRPGVTLSTFSDVPWNRPWFHRLGFRDAAGRDFGPGHIRMIDEERSVGLDLDRRTVMLLALDGPTASR